MNPNEWMTNPSPRFIYPMCRHCFYETSCGDCQAVTLRGLAVYEMYRIEVWFYEKILPRKEVEEEVKIDYDNIIDDVDSILEGEKGVKKEIDKERDRRKVRSGQRKGKKKVHDRGKRARKGKENVANNGKEKAK